MLPALDKRVMTRPLMRVRAVLTPVTPREGVNPLSQQYSSLNTAAHRRFDGGSIVYIPTLVGNFSFFDIIVE